MTLRVVGAGLGSDRHAFAQARARAAARRALLPHERAHRPRGRHRRVGRRDSGRRRRLGVVPVGVLRDGRLAGVRVLGADRSRRRPTPIVLLSLRESPEAWWKSVERTIVQALQKDRAARRRGVDGSPADGHLDGRDRRSRPTGADRDAAIAAYERHNERVRTTVARPSGWSSGGRATAGSRSARRSASRSPPSRSRIRTRPAEFRAAAAAWNRGATSGYDSVDGEEVMERMRKPLTRLTEPLVREDGALRPATWDEALDRAAAGFRAAAPPRARTRSACSAARRRRTR